METVIAKIKFRRGISSDSKDIILDEGEPAYLLDEKRLIFGDGITNGGNPVPKNILESGNISSIDTSFIKENDIVFTNNRLYWAYNNNGKIEFYDTNTVLDENNTPLHYTEEGKLTFEYNYPLNVLSDGALHLMYNTNAFTLDENNQLTLNGVSPLSINNGYVALNYDNNDFYINDNSEFKLNSGALFYTGGNPDYLSAFTIDNITFATETITGDIPQKYGINLRYASPLYITKDNVFIYSNSFAISSISDETLRSKLLSTINPKTGVPFELSSTIVSSSYVDDIYYGIGLNYNAESLELKDNQLTINEVYLDNKIDSKTTEEITPIKESLDNITSNISNLESDITSLNNQIIGVVPIGGIIMYGGTTVPEHWLLCDGGVIDSKYQELIDIVGANTPNLSGMTYIIRAE